MLYKLIFHVKGGEEPTGRVNNPLQDAILISAKTNPIAAMFVFAGQPIVAAAAFSGGPGDNNSRE